MFTTDKINEELVKLNRVCAPRKLEQCCIFLNLLIKWNKTYNLISKKSVPHILSHHLLDTLSLLPYLDQFPVQRLLDVGSGNGFPGIPLAIFYPNISLTLIEINHKKVAFLKQAVIETGLRNIIVVKDFVERFNPPLFFDAIIARGFSRLAELIRLTGHLLLPNGPWLAMQGIFLEETLTNFPAEALVQKVLPLKVPGIEGARHLIVAQKTC